MTQRLFLASAQNNFPIAEKAWGVATEDVGPSSPQGCVHRAPDRHRPGPHQ